MTRETEILLLFLRFESFFLRLKIAMTKSLRCWVNFFFLFCFISVAKFSNPNWSSTMTTIAIYAYERTDWRDQDIFFRISIASEMIDVGNEIVISNNRNYEVIVATEIFSSEIPELKEKRREERNIRFSIRLEQNSLKKKLQRKKDWFDTNRKKIIQKFSENMCVRSISKTLITLIYSAFIRNGFRWQVSKVFRVSLSLSL